MAIKYVYLLLYTMVLYLTFSILITLFKKKSILLFLSIRGRKKKQQPRETKMAEECRRESR